MDAERYARVRELFAAAVERAADERRAFLAAACGGDALLEEEVEALLAADRDAGRFLEPPPPARTEDPDREDLHTGRRIGAYRLWRCLGRGGMGAVYLAVRADREFRQTAAVKLLRAGMDSDEIVRRFKSERQILAGLDHPHIARLLDGGTTEDGQPYFVMEYVDGEPIDVYCDGRQLATAERLELFRRVCSAVQFAHQNLVVHRDLKPSNILVAGDGTPKLLDFGISKLLTPELTSPDPAPTATALRLMTPEYASPEQIQGLPITTASDVYSLGVVLFRLLTGRSPYRPAGSPAEMVQRICDQRPEKPSTAVSRRRVRGREGADPGKLRRRLVGDLDNIVLKALRKEPHRRYPSVEQLSDDIRRYLQGRPVRARRPTAAYRLGKFVRRHRLAVAVAAMLSSVNLLFGVVMALQRGAIASERDRARQEQVRAERVSSFLVDLFEVADPYQPPTAPPDARQLLDRGAERLEVELQDLKTRGEIEAAEPLYREALAIRRQLLGDGHPEVADSLASMANLLWSRAEYGAAESLYREAVQVYRQSLGGEHPKVALGLGNLALALANRGDYAAAEPLYREALQIRRRRFGDDHSEVTENLAKLAALLHATAEDHARAGLETLREILPEDHREVGEAKAVLSDCLVALGRREEMAPLSPGGR